jgi:hypothetical protein
MQPEGKTKYFEVVVNSLIHKNLVDGSADGCLTLHNLVGEYLELKKPIDFVTILYDQEGELKQGKELLAVFLAFMANNVLMSKCCFGSPLVPPRKHVVVTCRFIFSWTLMLKMQFLQYFNFIHKHNKMQRVFYI